MTDYISRDAVLPDAFCYGISCQECPFLKHPVYGGCKIEDFINSIPSANFQNSPKSGKWSDKQVAYRDEYGGMHFGYQCSVCGAIVNKTNYCGACGAKMENENVNAQITK